MESTHQNGRTNGVRLPQRTRHGGAAAGRAGGVC